MRSDTVFSGPVHLKCPDLDLEGLSVLAYQCGMQGLIHILLRHRDIILEPAGNGLVILMDDTECGIAVHNRFNDYPDRKEIVYLIQSLTLILHLLVDREKVLNTSVDLCIYSRFIDISLYFPDDGFDICFTLVLLFRDGILQFLVSLGFEIFKRQVIEFNLDPADAEALCYGAVNVECLTSDPYLALGRLVLERTHIVKAVGKFDHYDTDVTCHCIEHLTEVLSLHLKLFIRLVGNPRKRNALEFCHTGYEKRNLVSELLTHHRLGYFGIFENVMEKSRTYGLLVHFEFGQDYRNVEGMDDIRLTGFPDLSLVGIVGYRISLFDHCYIIAGMIFADITSKLLVKELGIFEIYILTYAAPFGDGTIFNVVNILHIRIKQGTVPLFQISILKNRGTVPLFLTRGLCSGIGDT